MYGISTLLIIIIVFLLITFGIKSPKRDAIHDITKQSGESATQLSLGDIVKSNKLKLFFVSKGTVTRKSTISQVVAVKGKTAAIYNLNDESQHRELTDEFADEDFSNKYHKLQPKDVTIKDLEKLSEDNILKLARDKDKENFNLTKFLAQDTLKQQQNTEVEDSDRAENSVVKDKVTKKEASATYTSPKYVDFKVVGEDNGRDEKLVKEIVTFYSTNTWKATLDSNDPVSQDVEVTMYGGQQNFKATVDETNFIGIGSTSDSDDTMMFSKTNKISNSFVLDKYHNSIISSISESDD